MQARHFILSLAVVIAVTTAALTLVKASGMPCTLNAQCGQPAANLLTLREDGVSLTGECVNGQCACAGSYGCSGCFVNGATLRTPLSSPFSPKIDVCTNAFGGGKCNNDAQCFNGLCIAGKCICWTGWTCEYCTLSWESDILNHAQCGSYKTGGAECAVDADCEHGKCITGKCQCSSGFVCSTCSSSQSHVLGGSAECQCEPNQCNGHGTCSVGECSCTDGFQGANCDIDPCADVECSGHGSCSAGECTCDSPYGGPDCSTGGGECTSNADCTTWAPLEGAEDPQRECDPNPCIDDKYGGTCVDGACQCAAGFTCANCQAKGDAECSAGVGGGECATNEECGEQDGGGTGGSCWNGRCLCFQGFKCPHCDMLTSSSESCPVFDPEQRRGGAECSIDQECGPNPTQGTGGGCIGGKCECYGGFYCPSCNHVGELEDGEKCVAQEYGGDCTDDSECKNGVCVNDKCICYEGWTCPWCNKEHLKPGDRIPGECESASECGFNVKCQDDPTRDCGFIQGGECQHGLCQCYQGFECSMCNAANVNGPEHCPDDYVKEGDTLECPPKPPRTGGAACESVDDCGPQDDGTFGGSCSDGKCKCWPGFTCPNCGRTRTEVDDGATCGASSLIVGIVSLVCVLIVLVGLELRM